MMTQALVDRKYRMIAEIIKLEDEALLAVLEDKLWLASTVTAEEAWEQAMVPLRKTLTVADMVSEQGYEPITADTFFEWTSELDIEESPEELLAALD